MRVLWNSSWINICLNNCVQSNSMILIMRPKYWVPPSGEIVHSGCITQLWGDGAGWRATQDRRRAELTQQAMTALQVAGSVQVASWRLQKNQWRELRTSACQMAEVSVSDGWEGQCVKGQRPDEDREAGRARLEGVSWPLGQRESTKECGKHRIYVFSKITFWRKSQEDFRKDWMREKKESYVVWQRHVQWCWKVTRMSAVGRLSQRFRWDAHLHTHANGAAKLVVQHRTRVVWNIRAEDLNLGLIWIWGVLHHWDKSALSEKREKDQSPEPSFTDNIHRINLVLYW